MEVICIEEPSFWKLLDEVKIYLKDRNPAAIEKWISDEEAMHLLNVKSKTTLQKLRDEGKIRFSQPQKRIILYDRNSINEYLDNNARETF